MNLVQRTMPGVRCKKTKASNLNLVKLITNKTTIIPVCSCNQDISMVESAELWNAAQTIEHVRITAKLCDRLSEHRNAYVPCMPSRQCKQYQHLTQDDF